MYVPWNESNDDHSVIFHETRTLVKSPLHQYYKFIHIIDSSPQKYLLVHVKGKQFVSYQGPDKSCHLESILQLQHGKWGMMIKQEMYWNLRSVNLHITWNDMNCIKRDKISGFPNQNSASRGFTSLPTDGPATSRASRETTCCSFVPTTITSFKAYCIYQSLDPSCNLYY